MKNYFYLIAIVFCILVGCNTSKSSFPTKDKSMATKNDTIRIANDELEYEVIIIDPGFSSWLASTAQSRNYYSQS